MTSITADRVCEAVTCIAEEINSQFRRRSKTTAYNERELWAELTCCILSSQVPYDLARAAAQRIDESLVLHELRRTGQMTLKRELLELLSTPLLLSNRHRRYRFPNVRASQIAAAFCIVRDESGSLAELLDRYPDRQRARSWLVANIPGVGPKQASMFLRNAVGSYDLAILDRHVLRYMRAIELCTIPNSSVTTIRQYERYEAQLQRHATTLGHAVGVLDWAIWIVMRTASRIDRRWVS